MSLSDEILRGERDRELGAILSAAQKRGRELARQQLVQLPAGTQGTLRYDLSDHGLPAGTRMELVESRRRYASVRVVGELTRYSLSPELVEWDEFNYGDVEQEPVASALLGEDQGS